ncbi:MAG TPA: proline--tRNA ligase [Acidimicrobiales bacterium]|nr:proline--tRNA ligase [Acidimicrobiales bacterium]
MATTGVLTSQADDFPRWYQDVLAKAELADNGPVRGTMVIRPYGYAIWERMQQELDRRIKAAGVSNAYFPLFIPESFLEREAEHVEGFSPELAVVTHGGGKRLEEPVVVRPTSETIINSFFSKWVQSHRDLPLLINQWCNVVRWELRPRLFLRTTEFLWQEGHTAHADEQDARRFALRVLHEVYEDFMVNVLAIPVLTGFKTERERFPGATTTWTCEAMMLDGKALQMGTSHELGENFARVFDITYLDSSGESRYVWQTSWGTSTRLMGALVMAHGDDSGLRLPPRLAPVQVAVVLVRDEDGAGDAARRIVEELREKGIRVELDSRTEVSFGRRVVDWELKGVPLRVEVGPREVKEGTVMLSRRDTGTKRKVRLDEACDLLGEGLDEVQDALLADATEFRDRHTVEARDTEEAERAAREGFAVLPAQAIDGGGEARLNEAGVSVRCLQGPEESEERSPVAAVVGRAY